MEAVQISMGAKNRLDGGWSCIVHSTYHSTVNLLLRGEYMVSLTGRTIPLHPFSLRLPMEDAEGLGLSQGMCCPVYGGVVHLPVGGSIDYAGAPSLDLSAHALTERPIASEALERLSAVGCRWAERSALGFLLSAGLVTKLSPFAGQIRHFTQAAVRGEVLQAGKLAQTLIGLGWGLTPTLDDFCVGLLAALWRTGRARTAAELGVELARQAKQKSTLVSAQFLISAAQNQYGAYLLAVLENLEDSNCLGLEQAVKGLLSVGHSSGTDTLAGLLTGLSVCIDQDSLCAG